jgi:hypothetical protein
MSDNGESKLIPEQYTGAKSVTSYTIKTQDNVSADRLFDKARNNLLNVNDWQKLAGPATAEFNVIDSNGKETNEPAKEGNYLRITIPVVPGSPAGKGHDWVIVEKIEEVKSSAHQYIAMRVRPAVPPFYDRNEIAHFFSDVATSTFCVIRQGKKIKTMVFGRNEKPNTSVHNFFNKVRNILIAIGAMIGLNKPQWKSLVKGWLTNNQ